MRRPCERVGFPWFLLTVLFFGLTAAPALGRAEFPAIPLPTDEIQQRLARVAASRWPGADRVVVFRGTNVLVESTGLTRRVEQTVTWMATPAGGRDGGVLRFDYDPATSDATLEMVRIFRKSGQIEQVDVAGVKDLAVPMHGIFWPMRMRLLALPGLEPGDGVEYTVRKTGFQMAYLASLDEEKYIPPQRGEFFEILQFGDVLPVVEQWFLVTVPKSKAVQAGVYNGQVESRQAIMGDQVQYRFWRSDLPAYSPMPNSQAVSDSAPKVVMSSLPDWLEKSRWFYSVSEPSFFVTPEITAKARAIIEGKRTDMERIAALNSWVANNVRYSGLSMGEGEGYTIHPATMTFDDRIGVCKDKAGMLIAMMRAVGYKETFSAMTMAGSRVESVPADQFNHAVVAWRQPDGGFVLLDPTWAPLSRELWSYAEGEQHYLIGTAQGENLAITPAFAASQNPLRVAVESAVGPDGVLRSHATVTADGFTETCLRRYFGYRPRVVWNDLLDGMVQKVSPSARLVATSLTEEDPEDLSGPFRFTIQWEVPDFVRDVGQSPLAIVPAAFTFFVNEDRINENLTVTGLGGRNRGLAFRTAKQLEYLETLRFPWRITLLGDPSFNLTTAYGSALVEVTATGTALTIRVLVRFTQKSVPLAGIPEYGSLLAAVTALRTQRLLVAKETP